MLSMAASKSETLSRVPMFADLTPSEVDALAQRAVEKRYAAGDLLFHEGDPCAGLFLLASGTVKIFKVSPSGREIMLAAETAPSSVAEVPLFDGGPYPASVSAITDVVAYLISGRDFRQACRQHPEVALKVLAVTGRRLRQLVSIVEAVSFGSVRQRLARTLLDFAQEAGCNPFPLPVTHQELAFRLGTVREVVSRNLSRFQDRGFLRLEKRQVCLLDTEGLQREAETEL